MLEETTKMSERKMAGRKLNELLSEIELLSKYIYTNECYVWYYELKTIK